MLKRHRGPVLHTLALPSFQEAAILEVFREVHVRGEPGRLRELINQITRDPAIGWGLANITVDYDQPVFHWEGGPVAPPANVFISGRGDALEVTNIVPVDVHRLSRGQYNFILDDFVSKNISPRAQSLHLAVELTPDRLPITHWLSEQAAQLLATFSRSANRSIPHPLDTKKWRAFTIKAHLDGTTLDTETLFRWLTEEERWPEDRAESLIIQFEFALALLDDYDKRWQ